MRDKMLGVGVGKSKQIAEENAAKQALLTIEIKDE